jgi:cation transport regulator ChaB
LPYESISELPKSVRNLPRHAKTIYMKAFNSAWSADGTGDDSARDKAAHEAAWETVKSEYEKDKTGEWVKIGEARSAASRHLQRHRRR